MFKKVMMLSLLAGFSFSSFSQSNNEVPKTYKEVFSEVGGPGVIFSVNYDSRFTKGKRDGFGFRAGAGFTLVDKDVFNSQGNYIDTKTRTVYTFPVALNYVMVKPNSPNMLEVGAGATMLSTKASILNYNENREGRFLGHVSFVYRHQPLEGGFSWRIGFTPIINPDGDIFPFAGLGFGYSFK